MKKRTKKFLDWFFETDRGEENVANCANLYELVERLQYRLEDMENEHMQLTREIAIHRREIGRLTGILDTLESRLPDED